jgi:hypothetical protein
MRNVGKLFHVLVVGSGALSALAACGGEDDGSSERQQPSDGTGGTGATDAGTGGSAGQGTAGEPGEPGGCDELCTGEPPGWVYCEGSCCWLGSTHPCCT